MEIHGFLPQTIVFIVAALFCVPLAKWTKLGSVLGYLVAGVAIGPFGLGFINDVESILHFAELGVVLLLFVIGLEMHPEKLKHLRRYVFGLGTLQLTSAALVLYSVAYFVFGLSSTVSLIIGLALGLSSTAFVLQLLAERNELNTQHGRGAFGVLIFQDLAVVPIMAIIPLMGAGSGLAEGSILVDFSRSALVIVSVILVGKFGLRHILRWIGSLKMKELMTASALLLVIGVAELMVMVKLSMGLGAFLAGLLLADSEYRHEVEADVEPFKGLLLGLFFIAVGMSLNLGLLWEIPGTVLGLVLGLMAIKALLLFPLARQFQFTNVGSVNLSLVLAQGGEFAFVIFNLAVKESAMSLEMSQTLSLVVTLSMALSPIVYVLSRRLIGHMANVEPAINFDEVDEHNPVIIAGFGRFGQIVGRVLRMKKIKFTALEHDPAHVEVVRKFGNKIFYGDASRLDLLVSAGAEKAKLFVLAIDDIESSVATAEMVRKHFPNLKILARARNRDHYFRLLELGVKDIIRETFYSSLEAARKSLMALGEAGPDADRAVDHFYKIDVDLLAQQSLVFRDHEKVIAASKSAAAQLDQAFTSDTKG